MIVGNGIIAKQFDSYKNNQNIVIFASGVSNSLEENIKSFEREESLLKKTISENKSATYVYFSTCSIMDQSVNQSKYVIHKLKMEFIVQAKASNFYVFRLPQVVGYGNNSIFINFLFNSEIKKRTIDIFNRSSRNLIGIEDVFHICNYIIQNKLFKNEITNIASPYNIKVLDLVSRVEKITKKTVKKNLHDTGYSYNICIDKLISLNREFEIFSDNYIDHLLSDFYIKYYK